MLNNPEIIIGEWSAYLSRVDGECFVTFCQRYRKIGMVRVSEILDDAYTWYCVCNADQTVIDGDGTKHSIPARDMRIIVQFIKEYQNAF